MGWQHINDELLRVVQDKTGLMLRLPIHPKLGEAIGKLHYNILKMRWRARKDSNL